jgi:hypothetical protein
MIIEDYFGSFDERMQKPSGLLAGKNNLVLVESSYWGLMAAQYALENNNRVKKIILLTQALTLPDFAPMAEQQLHACYTLLWNG